MALGHSVRTTGTGLIGALTAWGMQAATDHMTYFAVAIVTGLSCLFGMLSSLSRVKAADSGMAARQLLLNAGAVWIVSFGLTVQINASVAMAALVGLGVGLAGTRALELAEQGVLGLLRRMYGVNPVDRAELEQKLGDVRQDAQRALSERVVKDRRGLDVPPQADSSDEAPTTPPDDA